MLAEAVRLARPSPAIGAGLPANAAEAPLVGAAKVTRPPATGSPKGLATRTTRGAGKGDRAGLLWPSPKAAARVKPRDSKALISGPPPAAEGRRAGRRSRRRRRRPRRWPGCR